MRLNTDGLTGTIDIGPPGAEGWRLCAVAIHANGFSAAYVCELREEELLEFHSKLESAIAELGRRTAFGFCALEQGFAFEIDMDRGGHIDGKYEFARDCRGPRLSGSFTADQTHLREWARDLKRALAT